jgi:hypothetical protein
MKTERRSTDLVNVGAALLGRSVPLERRHDVSRFDCGNEGLKCVSQKRGDEKSNGEQREDIRRHFGTKRSGCWLLHSRY